ncbi:ABC transporter [Paenibacillus montaniterrae]|uniref:ABC transporter n=1 Tax=Paenibacillus montaniterrae TaxID=429341 RepID=A0A919YVY2_9BACL|nr:extracellular solute-binding protein [Paenibacillus montaniterrae]GIP18251.1 ABC transporter [Paenibacillus montaniterrae]
MLIKKKWPTFIILVCLVLIFVTACSKSNQTSNNPASIGENGEVDWSQEPEVTLNVFSVLANYAGPQPGWFAKLVKDKFNINLNIIQGGVEGRVATQMASGDLGDLIVGMGGKDYTDAIKGGLLLDWTKDDLLETYGKNIMNFAPEALEANRQQYGDGTAIYGIGHSIGSGDGPSEGAEMTFGPYLRWDLYQQLGSPTIKTLDDYLPLLKQMQELQPKSDSGKKTYGFSLWSDWDGEFSTLAKVTAQFHGYSESDGFNPGALILVKADEPDYQPILDDESYYMKGLKFYFDANQMGLLDPDSLTQTFGDVSNKFKDGQVLFAQFPWLTPAYNTPENTAAGKGFALVPFEEQNIYSSGFNPYGGNWLWSIGAKTKHPERVMALLDWMFSPDGIMEGFWGPKGLAWDLDDNGKPVLTEYGLQAMYNGDTPVPEEYGGGIWSDGAGNFGKLNNTTLALSQINPNTGEPYDYKLWTSELTRDPDPVKKSWQDTMGVLTDKELFVKNNQVAVSKSFFNGQAPVEEPSDIKLKRSQVGKVIKEYSWKMMFAKDEAEFDSLKQEMLEKAKGLGYDEVINWQAEQTTNTVFTIYK